MISALLRRRRYLALLFFGATLITIFFCYSSLSIDMPIDTKQFRLSDPPTEKRPVAEEAKDTKDDGSQKPLAPMAYGITDRPPFKDLTKVIDDLPSELLPKAPSDYDADASRRPRRLVFIGDVHGQRKALEAMLDKISFDPAHDHLILTGDLVNKGPDSAGVVELAMRVGASAVRGNHEDRVLLAHQAMKTTHVGDTDAGTSAMNAFFGGNRESASAPDEADVLELNPFSHGDFVDRETAASLSEKQIAWLADRPVILRVGRLPAPIGQLVVVHAGLVPGLKLSKQDPWAVMHMRTLKYPIDDARRERLRLELERAAARARPPQPAPSDEKLAAEFVKYKEALKRDKHRTPEPGEDVALPVDSRDGEPWAEAWDRRQAELAEDERMTVIYGHDAKSGLNYDGKGKSWTIGLDTGCVYGRKLSALVLEVTKNGVEQTLVQVGCDKGVRE
jgi:3',5'-cyclic AMP phosphodiesterase CpdA